MKKLLLWSALAVGILACSKKTEELAAPTTSGANTFGASINGVLWSPRGFGIIPTASILEANFAGNNSFRINARNFGSSPSESEIELFLVNVTGPGTILLNQSTAPFPNAGASYAMYTERRFQPISIWLTDASNTGTVTITRLDTVAKVISGSFQFTARDTYGSAAPVVVTDGRFDVKIQ